MVQVTRFSVSNCVYCIKNENIEEVIDYSLEKLKPSIEKIQIVKLISNATSADNGKIIIFKNEQNQKTGLFVNNILDEKNLDFEPLQNFPGLQNKLPTDYIKAISVLNEQVNCLIDVSLLLKELFQRKVRFKSNSELRQRALEANIDTVFERFEKMQPQCGFGLLGICCHLCNMGPCRLNPYDANENHTICGANAETMISWNLLRTVASGAAAHSSHSYHVIQYVKELLRKNELKNIDTGKLKELTERFKIPSADTNEQISMIIKKAEEDYSRLDESSMNFLKAYAPEKNIENWKKLNILPRNLFREVTEAMHRISIGVDSSYLNTINHLFRTALADLFAGSLIGTELQDLVFGVPKELEQASNYGVIKKDEVNLVIHGHSPLLATEIINASYTDYVKDKLAAANIKGLNIIGMCCSGLEILMRNGVPIIGNVLMQELAIITGAIELMVVDVQCLYPSLPEVASCFHTKIITTMPEAKIEGAEHIEFDTDKREECAKQIIDKAIANYQHRDQKKVYIPTHKNKIISGYSIEAILAKIGFNLDALLETIKKGSIRGVVALVGCNNPKVMHEKSYVTLAKNLLQNNILIVTTGCAAHSLGNNNMMHKEASILCGNELKKICTDLNIPPCLHMGSCVDNSRIFILLTAIANALNVNISDLPVAGATMEWMSEKAVSIGAYFTALGVTVVLGTVPPVLGSNKITQFLANDIKDFFSAKWIIEPDANIAAQMILKHINNKRKNLGI